MSEFDDRVTEGLRELVDRAPVDAEVWDETGRYVAKHRRRRQAAIASVAAVTLAAVGIGVAANAAHGSKRQVNVAHGITVPPPALATTPLTSHPTPKAPSTTAPRATTSTIAPVRLRDACPTRCIGRSDADVDGDGRVDHIGFMETKTAPATYPAQGEVKVRVVLATGAVSEFTDNDYLFGQWLGAADVNGDGKAEIFYMNSPGAHSFSGRVLRWDGTKLVLVRDEHGLPFEWFIDSALFYDGGFRCTGTTMVFTVYQYQGAGDGKTGPWSGSETTYSWRGGNVVKTSTRQLTAEGRKVPDEAYGAHCPGLPLSTSSLLQP